MSTIGQFSTKNPTIKRILREATELSSQPSADYHAAPLETDLFEWHFTIRGPPSPSPFEGGIYHGRIVLPPAYPLKPPSFRFLTPSGRFEVNREICLSISGHHEETWQPAWGIRTALVAIRSFMDTDARGQLGGMESGEAVRRRLAAQSGVWKCGTCGKDNAGIMREQEEAVKENGGEEARKEDVVPEELRLGYRDELGNGKANEDANGKAPEQASVPAAASAGSATPAVPEPSTTAQQPRQSAAPTAQHPQPAAQQQQQVRRQEEGIPPWIDKAIYGVVIALLYLLWRKLF